MITADTQTRHFMIKAKIYKPSKTAMQSGRRKGESWVLEYMSNATRTPDSLMGWTQAEDTLNQVKLSFDDLDSAEAYAESKGLAYTVTHPQERKIKPRNYGDNFKYDPPAGAAKPKPKAKAAPKPKAAAKPKAAPSKAKPKTAAKPAAKAKAKAGTKAKK
jgi:hypothetical protein